MTALKSLIIAGIAAALLCAPAAAKESMKAVATAELAAQTAEVCQGWGVRCTVDVTPSFCFAEDMCAVALPGSALIRYDARMDAMAAN